MPHIDARTGDIVLRVVYDGMPTAGKTTNVRQLESLLALQRRGAMTSPGTHGERTEFFDWLDFTGGFIDGRRVRCQILSVPGQTALLHRRSYLLEKADAIVFVADSRPETFAESRASLATTLSIAHRTAGALPPGIVVQANKQDLPGALAPAAVVDALDVPATTPSLGSNAVAGEGVLPTFLLAVRLATDRVRALLLTAPISESTVDESPEALHSAMLLRESPEALLAGGSARGAAEEPPSFAPERETAPDAVQPAAASIEPSAVAPALIAESPGFSLELGEHIVVEFSITADQDGGHEPPRVPEPAPLLGRMNMLQPGDFVTLPVAHELFSGHVWPPVKGRSNFVVALSAPLVPSVGVLPWAPVGALELVSEAGWYCHSTTRWGFANEADGRLFLLSLVRRLSADTTAVPESRALALAKDGDGWRLWMVTARPTSLEQALEEAFLREGPPAAARLTEQIAAHLRRSPAQSRSEMAVPAGAAGLGLGGGRIVQLALDEGEDQPHRPPRPVEADLRAAIAARAAVSPAFCRWFEAEGRHPLTPAPPGGVHRHPLDLLEEPCSSA